METNDIKKLAIELDECMEKTGVNMDAVMESIEMFHEMDEQMLMEGYDRAILFKVEVLLQENYHLVHLSDMAIATCEFVLRSRMVKK